jgi:hypothetical protein
MGGRAMTTEEYQRICERVARKAIRYAATKVADEEAEDDLEVQCERWITMFLNERLPDIDEDVLLEVTRNAGAFEKDTGRAAPNRKIAAQRAFQADVWAVLNQEGLS